jgi:hypothetical protein
MRTYEVNTTFVSSTACFVTSALADANGKNQAWRTDRTFKHFKNTMILSGLLTVAFAITPGFQPMAVASGMATIINGSLVVAMIGFDAAYDGYISPGDQSDGIVPFKSQQYPGVAVDPRFQVRDSDTHLGATKSLTTHRLIRLALRVNFGLEVGQ